MALVDTGVRALANKLPKVISPRTHAIIDYATAGSFFVATALFWKRHKRAALGTLACGLAGTTVAMLTDYPGGVFKVMDFPTHGRVDVGMVAGLESLPRFLRVGACGWFFRAQGLAIVATTGLTDFAAQQRPKWRGRGGRVESIA
ncbi:MAG TPA: hypothetical protein VKB56_07345 [Terriglobales bacterium]|nr:hypothetical protein [Terriglobales bacterium]